MYDDSLEIYIYKIFLAGLKQSLLIIAFTMKCRWSIPKSDWLYFCNQRWRSSIQSAKTRPGAHCGSDHELLITKFKLKLKKVGKTTRPFRYDLNQIPYDYTMEVTNRFKRLHLIDRVPEELWTEVHDICIGGSDQDHPQEKEMQEGKMVAWRGLTNSWEKKRSERQRREDIPIWMPSSQE